MELRGQRVLITGASSGIGAGLAEEFARRGATVGLAGRDEHRLADVLSRCPTPGSRYWVCDLEAPGAGSDLGLSVLATLGGIDVLVNNAGIPLRRPVTALDGDTTRRIMAINFHSAVDLTLALLPSMLSTGAGRIVNICSIAASLSSPGEAAYDASKAALTAFSEAMAIELWESGIKVLAVHPGLVDTPLLQAPGNEPLPRSVPKAMPVTECVAAIFAALERGSSQVFIPEWFGAIAADKARDIDSYMAGAAAFYASEKPK